MTDFNLHWENISVIVYILILLVFVFANLNFDKWIFLDVLWIPI